MASYFFRVWNMLYNERMVSMKTRILIDARTYEVMRQPEGYFPMTKDFVEQYNCACNIINPLIPDFNANWEGKELGEEYERAYYDLFLRCLNSVEEPKRAYNFTFYDGENCEYEINA